MALSLAGRILQEGCLVGAISATDFTLKSRCRNVSVTPGFFVADKVNGD